MFTDHYKTLGVPPGIGAEDLRGKYLALARKHHPDIDPNGADRMAAITEAYTLLSNLPKRQHYDRERRMLVKLCERCDGTGQTPRYAKMKRVGFNNCEECRGTGVR